MIPAFEEILRTVTKAKTTRRLERIQSLWSGYGEIARYGLEGGTMLTAIVKNVVLPEAANHPRGWNTDVSHQRKVRSYEVEAHFYQQYAARCSQACRVPKSLAQAQEGTERLLILEDLDASGFPLRAGRVSESQWKACVRWLAHFHATFLETIPTGLWETGTYWHLATRPDELAAMHHPKLKASASAIDQALSGARYQTLVHGDAKVANFCFSEDGASVAAVDFQYVGGGCGMKDLAYFMGSVLTEEECEAQEKEILGVYFTTLRGALQTGGSKVDPDALETEWRGLYAFAWADFHRFLLGWMPGHQKLHGYSAEQVAKVLAQLA